MSQQSQDAVVVPREPTQAMIEAFYHAEGPAGPDRIVSWSVATAMARGNVIRHLDDIFANAYRAMLLAAPVSPDSDLLEEAVGLLRDWQGVWFRSVDARSERAIALDTDAFLSKVEERGHD